MRPVLRTARRAKCKDALCNIAPGGLIRSRLLTDEEKGALVRYFNTHLRHQSVNMLAGFHADFCGQFQAMYGGGLSVV